MNDDHIDEKLAQKADDLSDRAATFSREDLESEWVSATLNWEATLNQRDRVTAEMRQQNTRADKAERAILELQDVLLDVTSHGEHDHQIESHADTLPQVYRQQAIGVEKAIKIVSAVVWDIVGRNTGTCPQCGAELPEAARERERGNDE